jgi:type IV secretion system protein VirD4
MGALIRQPTDTTDYESPYLGYWLDSAGKRLRYREGKHLLSFGTTGSGKSTSLAVVNLALLRRSMIVIDPKGQLAAITARRRQEIGRVIILNPFGELCDVAPHLQSDGWNPMRQLDPNSHDFGTDARSIAEAMGSGISDGKSEFFETSTENLWSAFTMWERLTRGKSASLRAVLEQFSRPPKELLATLKAMSESDNFGLRVMGSATYSRLTDEKSQSTSLQDVLATIIKNSAFLFDDRIGADMWAGDAIDFENMHKEITTIFVILPLSQLRKQAKWLRMFINLALGTLYRTPPRAATLPPVLCMLDEFANIGKLPEIVNALSVGRDYNIQLWCFLQYLHQLKKQYAEDYSAFFSGAGAVTTFGIGDWETAEHFSKMLGKQEVELTSKSNSYNHGNSKRNGQSLQTNPSTGISQSTTTALHAFQLMEPSDFRMQAGETRNFIDPSPLPIRGFAPGYWNFPAFSGLDRNPYFHG